EAGRLKLVQSQTMTTPAPSTADALSIAFLPAAASLAQANHAILDAVHAGDNEKLAHALKFSRGAVKIAEGQSNATHKLLLETAVRCGLTLPPRPAAPAGWRGWLDAVHAAGQQALAAAGGSRLAAFEAGAAAGDLHLATWLGRSLIHLRISAPEHP